MTGDPIISVRGLSFTYKRGDPDILHDVTVSIHKGAFVALLGQNGAGKTTLAKHFNGLLKATRGCVEVAGHSASEQRLSEIARVVGYCYQNPDHQIFATTVEKEVAFGPSNLGFGAKEVASLVERALAVVGLSDARHVNPFSLGRGQRQLVAVASILAMDPPVLVIDEPTTGMDHAGSVRIMGLLRDWASEGRTIIVITHDMDIVCEFIPRSIVMAGGVVIADGATGDVFRDEAVLERARLVAPAPVIVADRLRPYGIGRIGSINAIVADITRVYEQGAVRASRL